ncbi:MAG: PKD domain-containing protein [Bacteroidetes bacterium]|nr:PKD domain-containing protein [Bacteroidota bacterium]
MDFKQQAVPRNFIAILFIILPFLSFSQSFEYSSVKKAFKFDISRELKEVEPIPPGQIKSEWKNGVVPNKFDFHEKVSPRVSLDGPDPILQKSTITNRNTPEIVENFNGNSNIYGVAPPDTQGDVSLDHYFQMVNNGFRIWDKSGNSVYGPADNITLWNGFPGPWSGTNDGDPVVLYDEYADRWIASQFSLPYGANNGPYYELVAVSATSDPTGVWYRYAFEFDKMPDYPKLGVWHDAYYLTINQFESGSWHGGGVCMLDREAMLAGDPDAEMLLFDIGSGYGSMMPADADGAILPPEDSPSYLVSLGPGSLRLLEAHTDWDNTSNATVEIIDVMSVMAYSNSDISISQPGTGQKLDALEDRLMFRLQYRNFEDYQVMVTNHSVNVGSGRAGVRWYELRNYGEGWEIYQQGTYAPDDGNSRWMGSVAMNAYGVLMAGYSVSSSSTYPSIRFSGQSADNSGSGEFDIPETSIFEGTKSQTGVNRWGDYAMMSIDPSDDKTFWYTTQYSNGGWNWRTRIASFYYDQEPVANFVASDTLIPLNQSIDFTDKTLGAPSTWEWTFYGGEPETSTEQNPTGIVYSEDGTYDVRLIVSNDVGDDTLVMEDFITASGSLLPEVHFSADKLRFCTGETIAFTDATKFFPIAWEWEFSPSNVTFVNGTDQNSQHPEVLFSESAEYSVTLTAWNTNGPSSLTIHNYINSGGFTPYYIETFEDIELSMSQWTIENPDEDKTWEFFETGGTSPGNTSVGINFSDYFELGARDRLISPPFNLSGLNQAVLSFQHAYAKKFAAATDSLIIYISEDCGESWTRIFADGENGSGNFATHELIDEFWPETESDWCISGWGASCIEIDLSPWAGLHDIQIAFESYCYWGNPLFIDNVSISQYVGQTETLAADRIKIYPNPANGKINIQLPAGHDYLNMEVINPNGRNMLSRKIDGDLNFSINEDKSLPGGIYLIRFITNNNQAVKKVVVK